MTLLNPLPRPLLTRRTSLFAACLLPAAALLSLSGCAVSRLTPSAGATAGGLHGQARGGQQPIAGASLQLWASGATGNQSAATPLLTTPVLTNTDGSFTITGDYTCPAGDSQVYLSATGGNPGLPGNASNPAIALMTALGDCGNLSASSYVSINEVTTVAAAIALSPFGASLGNIGASATNAAGLHNAMLTAAILADPATGVAPGASLPANATVESAKIYTLANLLAACVNSDGTGFCPGLFADATPSGGSAPADTFSLALSIAANPANNVAQLFSDVPAAVAFAGGLNRQPSDWTVSISYTGGGLASPTSVAVDGTGQVWVANVGGVLSAFTPQGLPVWANGVTGGGLDNSVALAIDSANTLWVGNMQSTVNSGQGTVSHLSTAGVTLAGTDGLTAGNIGLPAAIASDPDGTTWVSSLASSTVAHLASDGTPLSGPQGYGAGILASPSALALDANHQVWIASRDNGLVTQFDGLGNVLNAVYAVNLPDSLAIDTAGTVWVGDNADSSLAAIAGNGGILQMGLTGGGLDRPRTLLADAGGHLFATDNVLNTVAEFAASNGPQAPGTPLSPAAGLGAGALMQQPFGAAADSSGTLWVTSFGDNRLIAFPGLAAPTHTPAASLPQQP